MLAQGGSPRASPEPLLDKPCRTLAHPSNVPRPSLAICNPVGRTPPLSMRRPQVADIPEADVVDVPFGLSVWAVVVTRYSVDAFFRESGISQIVTPTSIAGRFFDTKDGTNALADTSYEGQVLDEER